MWRRSHPDSLIGATGCNLDGSLDTSFDGDGKRYVDFAGQSAGAADVAVESSGKVVVSGGTGGNAVVVRLTAAGATDATYAGGAGYRTVDFGGADTSLRMTLDREGRAVVAGRTSVGGDTFLFRLTTGRGTEGDTTLHLAGKQRCQERMALPTRATVAGGVE